MTARTQTPPRLRTSALSRIKLRRAERRALVVPAASPENPLRALLGVRVLLCSWIFVHHVARWATEDTTITNSDLGLLRQGQGATTALFMLSGLVLTWRYGSKFHGDARLDEAVTFIRRRFASIWPIAIAALLLGIAFELFADRLSTGEYIAGSLTHLLLVQSWFPVGGGEHALALRLNGPPWTLSTLFALYILFPLITHMIDRLVHTRAALFAVGAVPWLLVAIFAVTLRGEQHAVWMLHVSPVMRSADFLAGIAIGTWLLRDGLPTTPRLAQLQIPALVLVIAAGTVLSQLDNVSTIRYGTWFIPVMALFLITLISPSGALGRIFGAQPMTQLANRAFAWMMLHSPIIGIAWYLGLFDWSKPGAIAVTLCVSLAVAEVVHQHWEKPLRRRLRGGMPASPKDRGPRDHEGALVS